MDIFMQDYYSIFMLVVFSLSILILLREPIGFLCQLAFSVVIVFSAQMDLTWIMIVFLFIQIALTLIVIYQLKNAIDRNYQLVLEKTRATERYLTQDDYTGSQKSFFFNKR